MSREPESLVGRVLCNTYQLERLLVSGGMATVYAARHLRTGGMCAVKVLSEEATSSAEIHERFQDEARISCSLRHPNIVQVMDLDQMEDGTPFLVMELLQGEDLHDRLHRQGRMPIAEALQLAREVGSALHAAHCRDVVHRDLKPQNIYLARFEFDGRLRDTAKVLDFGLSKIRKPAAKATRDQLVLGTPRYLAPEGALGQNSQLDGRADQFALAVILYRALSGRLPFDADEVAEVLRQVVYDEPPPLGELVPELPVHFRAAIERAMCKDKEGRFLTMLDFVDALGGLGAAPTLATAPRPGGDRPQAAEGPVPSVALTGIAPLPHSLSTASAPHGAGKGFSEAPTFVAPLNELVPSQDKKARVLASARGPSQTRLTVTWEEPEPPPRRVAWTRTFLGFAVGALLALPVLFMLRAPEQEKEEPKPQERAAPPIAPPAPAVIPTMALPSAHKGVVAPEAAIHFPPLRVTATAQIGAPPPALTAQALLSEAKVAQEKGAHDRAIALAHAALGRRPEDRRPLQQLLGVAACRAGRLRLACSVYRQLDPLAQTVLEQSCLPPRTSGN